MLAAACNGLSTAASFESPSLSAIWVEPSSSTSALDGDGMPRSCLSPLLSYGRFLESSFSTRELSTIKMGWPDAYDCLDDCVDLDKPPVMVFDQRAGHGPGIGGFKQESEVGMASLSDQSVCGTPAVRHWMAVNAAGLDLVSIDDPNERAAPVIEALVAITVARSVTSESSVAHIHLKPSV